MMKVNQYTENDYGEIYSWFNKRHITPPEKWALSNEGFIVRGVAAGFLYLTNSSLGFIDMFVSNPDSSSADRKNAIDMIMARLLMVARNEEIRVLVCSTKFQGVEEIPLRHGFKKTGQHMSFARSING